MSERRNRILCVEENRDSREMVAALLRQFDGDYDGTAVVHAADAVEVAAESRLQLALLATCVHGLDAGELCRRLRERGVIKPIMFFSAMGVQTKDRDYVLAAGADEFLVKSIDLDRFTETVERLLGTGS